MLILILVLTLFVSMSCTQSEEKWTPDWDTAYLPDKTIGFTILTPDMQFSWPFETPAKAEMSLNHNEPSQGGKPYDFTLREDKGGDTYTMYAANGFSINSGKYGMRVNGEAGDYILFPAFRGLRLSKLEVVTGNKDSMRSPSINTEDGAIVDGGDMYLGDFADVGASHTWTLSNTEKNTRYRLSFNYPGIASIRSLSLTYTSLPNEVSAEVHEPLEDQWPDFSRVGYRWSDEAIPDIPVVKTIEAPQDGSDATELIQNAIDGMPGPGALLLKAGTYYVSGQLNLNRSGVVLRGEGLNTVIHATGTEARNFITLGKDVKRVVDRSTSTRINVSRLAVGQMYVPVKRPDHFSVGDRIVIYRPGTENWIHDLKMDQIPQNSENRVEQWTAEGFSMTWERMITDIQGDKLYLDAPIVMEISDEYGGGYVMKCSWDRITESGIENLAVDTDFDRSEVDANGNWCDEDHAWSAILILAAEHCWVRGVTTSHFGFAALFIHQGSRNITVEDCHSKMPVSLLTGSRRYAFEFHMCELCLVKDCTCEYDRHGYACSARTPGPNVYLRCKATKMFNELGPHQRWSTGILYDNCVSDKGLIVQDRNNYGTGHGWSGTNIFFYNCEATPLICQSPWVTGKNWCIGCIGERRDKTSQGLERPAGEWISYGVKASPESLYESQLEERHRLGKKVVPGM